MSCLHPIHIRNTSKVLEFVGTPFEMDVPCGHCAECKKQMQSEYYFRAYYQAMDTLARKGYVYFDTLTYDNRNVPHISDFVHELRNSILDHMCFNLDHYRHFFVRLRRCLKRHGFDPAHGLKYFLCSEYGTDDTKTHRPHYHILFYITIPNLPVELLSEWISDCWTYGRTDGIKYKGLQYIKNHTFDSLSDKVYMTNICNYVAKYVTKSSSFEKTIDSRINLISKRLEPEFNSDEYKDKMKKIERNIREFHRQSQGFGIYGLQMNDPDRMFQTGMMEMVDSKHIVSHIPMPMYFQRKLYYNLTHDEDGNKSWKLNDKGIEYKLSRLDDMIRRTGDKFAQWYSNLDNNIMVGDYYSADYVGKVMDSDLVQFLNKSSKDYVTNLLHGRSWNDFAEYILVYKGRFKSPEQLDREINEEKYYVDEKHDFYKKTITQSVSLTNPLFNYVTNKDYKTFNSTFISETKVKDLIEFKEAVQRGDVHRHGEFKEFCINEYSDPKFIGFDKLYNHYVRSLYTDEKRKNKVFNAKEDFKKQFDIFK